MVLIDLTSSGFATELVAFLAPYLNGEPASEDLITRGPAAKLAALAAKLGGDGASPAGEVDASLKALVAALVAHTSAMPAEDMLAAYTLMWEIVLTSTPSDQPQLALEVAKQMAAGLTSTPTDRPTARLAVMAMLYDAAGKANPAWRYELLVAYVDFLRASGHAGGLPAPADVERWLSVWGCSREERLRAYDACAQCARKLAGEEAAQQWWLLVLRECEGTDAAQLARHKPSALAAVCAAIRSPSQFQLDELAALAAVRQLGGAGAEPSHADAARLLGVFVSGSLADLAAFQKERPAALAELGIDGGAARRKMQLLSLVTLAHDAGAVELPFARVAGACEVALDEVEELVFDAIGAALVDARIDEVRSVVVVSRALRRTFGPAEWRALHAQLGQWRSTIQAVVEVVGSAPVAV